MSWYLRACPACSGDLVDSTADRGWVECFMCSRTYKVAELPLLIKVVPTKGEAA